MSYEKPQVIYSSTALASKQREVKDAAREGIVHITENGNGAFVFCSEEVFASEPERVREAARYEAELGYTLRRAAKDVAAGHYETDFDKFRRSVTEERANRG
jgi:hypothetical protein